MIVFFLSLSPEILGAKTFRLMDLIFILDVLEGEKKKTPTMFNKHYAQWFMSQQ